MNKLYFLVIGFSIIILLSFVYFVDKNSKPSQQINNAITKYSKDQKSKPSLKVIGKDYEDAGRVKVSATYKTNFKIKNIGKKVLQIYTGTTSCGCTFGKVKKGEVTSPQFGMHNQINFLIEVLPNEEAEIELIYKPYLMPVEGKTQRSVTIKTNDPDNPEFTFGIEAFVY